MAVLLEQRPTISESDVDFLAVDCTPYLDPDETVSTVAIIDTFVVSTWTDGYPIYTTDTDLVVDNETPNIAAQIILRRTVAIGKGIQMRVTGGQEGVQYAVRYKIVTSKGRTAYRDAIVTVSQ